MALACPGGFAAFIVHTITYPLKMISHDVVDPFYWDCLLYSTICVLLHLECLAYLPI